MPAETGAYVLLIELTAIVSLAVGRHRPAILAPGRYLYCGSAYGPGGLRARVGRHMRREKRVRWHVDQLTTIGDVAGAWVFPGGNECDLVARLGGLPNPRPGFGGSDCRRSCAGHLRAWPEGWRLSWG